jgi:uncharacterized protein YegL
VSSATILPVYLVCDLSSSMADGARVAALHGAVTALRDAVWLNPVVSDVARIGVLGFATSARVLLPLCDIAMVDELPSFTGGGLTSYASAFSTLRTTIDSDLAHLAADGFLVLRPLVFFVSDGEPTDPGPVWRAALAELLHPDFARRPEIVAFAVGEASSRTLAAIATARCFVAGSADAVDEAIAGMGDLVVRSVVASSVSGQAAVSSTPPGFEEVDLL